jgi:hypothetical protein
MTSTFERAMAQNANTVPLRHELAGSMSGTASTVSGGVLTALGIGTLFYFGNDRTSGLVPLMVAGLGGLAIGGYLQNR